jgi:hypothetical protein
MDQEINVQISKQIMELREEIEKLPRSQNGRRMGIEDELRVRVVGCFQKSGMGLLGFSREVGISMSVLGKWSRSISPGRRKGICGFRKIQIQPEGNTGYSDKDKTASLIMEAPKGIRIIGLRVEDVTQILRDLC